MNSRKVIGKRIVAVEHERWDNDGAGGTRVTALVLEDGTVLLTHAYEAEDDPVGEILVGQHKWRNAARAAVLKLLKLEAE